MDIFDVIGPVMVGPSSSHTAGAVRIGYMAGHLLGEDIKSAEILLYGSFLDTGKGHGTKKALVAGLLGMKPDDLRIPESFDLAKEKDIDITFGEARLTDAHPNTAEIILTGVKGAKLDLVGESIGGGKINVAKLDGIETNFAGDGPTLIVYNIDQPGHVADVANMLARKGINIATMQLYRSNRGGEAVMVVECDSKVPESEIEWLSSTEGVLKVIYFEGL